MCVCEHACACMCVCMCVHVCERVCACVCSQEPLVYHMNVLVMIDSCAVCGEVLQYTWCLVWWCADPHLVELVLLSYITSFVFTVCEETDHVNHISPCRGHCQSLCPW